MTTTTTRPLPTTRDILDRHWMPPEPVTDVTRLTAQLDTVSARRATIAATLTDIHTADATRLADSDDLDQALTDLDAATITVTLLERQVAVLDAAARLLATRIDTATHTDPDYTAWRAACQALLTEWAAVQQHAPADERHQRLELFAYHRRLTPDVTTVADDDEPAVPTGYDPPPPAALTRHDDRDD